MWMNKRYWLNVGAILSLVIACAFAWPTVDEEQECARADFDYKYVRVGDDTVYYFCASKTIEVVYCAESEHVVWTVWDINCVSSSTGNTEPLTTCTPPSTTEANSSEVPTTPPCTTESSQSTPSSSSCGSTSTTACGPSSSSSTESTRITSSGECTKTVAPPTAIVPFFNCLDKPDGFRYRSHQSDNTFYVCRHLIEIHQCVDGYYVNQDFQCVPKPTTECQTTTTSTTTIPTISPTPTAEECTCTGTTCYCNTAVCNSTDCDAIDPDWYNK